jgi:hydrogenase maturation protein HypF
VAGIVQGVGFRPFVYRLARECGITGTVRNTGHGVVIEAHGAGVADFVRRLQEELPPLALLTDVLQEDIPADDARDFSIIASAAGPVTTALIPADVALCEDCRRELLDPANRRHQYPFINCTNCGPRYTITAGIPYDRPSTSMRDFPLCAACAAEYHDPDDPVFMHSPTPAPTAVPRCASSAWAGPSIGPGHWQTPSPCFAKAASWRYAVLADTISP